MPEQPERLYQVQITTTLEVCPAVYAMLREMAPDRWPDIKTTMTHPLAPRRRMLQVDLPESRIALLATLLVGLGTEVYDWWTVPRREHLFRAGAGS